jgi:hypothetical protein
MSDPTPDHATRIRHIRYTLAAQTAEGPPLRFIATYPNAPGGGHTFDGMPTTPGPAGILVQDVRP